MGFLKSCFCIPRTIDSEYHGNNYARSESESSVQVPITPHPQGVIAAPLVEAAEAGEMMRVKTLLREGMDPNQRGQGGRTALHAAVAKNKRSVALALLEGKADPNLKDQEGCTPLHLAARYSCHDIVPMLLLAGANLSASTKSGQVAMDMAPDTASSVALRRAILIAAEQSGGIKGVEALLESNTSCTPSPATKPPSPPKAPASDTAASRDQQTRGQAPAPKAAAPSGDGQRRDDPSSPARTPSPTTPVQAQPKMTPAAALLQRAVSQAPSKPEVSPRANMAALLSTPPAGRGSAHAVAAFPDKLNSQTFVMGNNVSAAEAFASPAPSASPAAASPAPASAFGSAAAAAPVAAAAGGVFQEQYQRQAAGAEGASAPAAVGPAPGNTPPQPAPGAAVAAANGGPQATGRGDANGTAANGSAAKNLLAAGSKVENGEAVEGAGQLAGVMRLPAVKAVRRLRDEGQAASSPLSPMGQKAHMLVEREMGSAVVQKQLDQAQLTVDERREVTRELAVALRKREMRMSLKADEISATIQRVRLNHVTAEAQQKPPPSDFSRASSQHQQAVAFLSNSIPELKPRTSSDSPPPTRDEEPASPSVATANSAFTDATEGAGSFHSALNTAASTASYTSPMPLQGIASTATSPMPSAARPAAPAPAVPSAIPSAAAPAPAAAAPKELSTVSMTSSFPAPTPPAPTPPSPAPKTSPPSTGPSTPPYAAPAPPTPPSTTPPSSPPPSFDYDYQPTPPPANASVLTTTSSFSYSTSVTFSASPLSTFEPSDIETAPIQSLLSENLAPISENPADDTWLTSSDPSFSDPRSAASPHTPIDSSDLNLPSIRASPLPKTPTPKTPGSASPASKKYSLRTPKQSPAPAPSPTPAKSPAPASTPASTLKKSVPKIDIPNSAASPESPSPMTPQPDFVTPTRPHHSPSTLITPKSGRQDDLATPRSRKTPMTPLSRSMTGGTPRSGTTPRSNSSLSGLYTPRRSGSQTFRVRGSTTSVTSSTAADDRPPWRY